VPALTVQVPTQIGSVDVVASVAGDDALKRQRDELEQARQKFVQAARTFQQAAEQLRLLRDSLFCSHREQIARLSVAIAEKVLLREIGEGRYEIAKIVEESLKAMPGGRNIVVRLNPQDLEQYSRHAGTGNGPAGVELTPDPQLRPAQCIIESDKGVIEFVIEEHLRQIEQALKSGRD